MPSGMKPTGPRKVMAAVRNVASRTGSMIRRKKGRVVAGAVALALAGTLAIHQGVGSNRSNSLRGKNAGVELVQRTPKQQKEANERWIKEQEKKFTTIKSSSGHLVKVPKEIESQVRTLEKDYQTSPTLFIETQNKQIRRADAGLPKSGFRVEGEAARKMLYNYEKYWEEELRPLHYWLKLHPEAHDKINWKRLSYFVAEP